MIRALDRKMLRDLTLMWGQALAIGAVIACGVATFVMSLSTLRSLQHSQQTYYERYRFAHVFAQLKRAPNTLADRIAEIPGIARVDPRVVEEVTLDVPGMKEPAVGRLISIPAIHQPILNNLHLRRGRYIEPGRAGEVLVGESFAESHGFEPGDKVYAVINGSLEELRIVGIVLSPEYVLQIQGGSILPDTERFGVFWMGYDELASAFDMDGAFNDVTVSLMRGANEDEVIRRLDDLLARYGGVGAYGRSEQLSNRYLSDEIKQLKSMGMIAPSIFLGVAAFLLNVVLSRMISTQREQIAALKAFGYTKWEVGFHYLKLVLVISVVGAVAGTAVGAWMGRHMTQMYTEFYKFPMLNFELDAPVIISALVVSAVSAGAGTFFAVRSAVKLPPAEAMRPEPPANYRPTVVERWGLQRLIPHAMRMILRHMERRPLKAVFSVLGIAMAQAVLILGNYGVDSLDYVIQFMFTTSQRQDMTVTFVQPLSSRVIHEIDHLPGVIRSEVFRSVPTRMRFAHRSRRVAIMGLSSDGGSRLYRLLDTKECPVGLPSEGMMLSRKLAEVLGAEVGDRVRVEVLEGDRMVRDVPITGLIRDMGGLNAYMYAPALHRMLREDRSISGAFLQVDRNQQDELYLTLKNTPMVAAVNIKAADIESFEKTVAENLLKMQTFMVLFAGIIAFGVVYNSARISLAEWSRDLATLRVIGFTRREISVILLGELGVLTLLAIPVGCGIGYAFAWGSSLSLDTEVYRIPLVIDTATYSFATVVVLVATLFSGLVVRRNLDRLDLVSVLKTRE